MIRPARKGSWLSEVQNQTADGRPVSVKLRRLLRELGYQLEWEELPSKRDCRISSYLNDVDPENEADWPRQREWLAKRLTVCESCSLSFSGSPDP